MYETHSQNILMKLFACELTTKIQCCHCVKVKNDFLAVSQILRLIQDQNLTHRNRKVSKIFTVLFLLFISLNALLFFSVHRFNLLQRNQVYSSGHQAVSPSRDFTVGQYNIQSALSSPGGNSSSCSSSPRHFDARMNMEGVQQPSAMIDYTGNLEQQLAVGNAASFKLFLILSKR